MKEWAPPTHFRNGVGKIANSKATREKVDQKPGHPLLWLDRQIRFGKTADDSEIVTKIQNHQAELAKSWQNYLNHRDGHA